MPTAKRKKAIDSGSAGSEEVTRNASVSKKLRSPSKHVSVAIVKRPREMVAKDTLRSKARSEVGEKRGGSAGKEVVKKVKINGKGKPTAVASCGDSSAVSTGDKIIPKRNKQRQLVFADRPEFRPNLTPKEVLQMGSFGGTYYRVIKSSVTGKTYRDAWKEFPADWFEGLKVEKHVTNPNYLNSVNKYGVHCGGDLHMWESSGWMRECDPYGWFQWYCRFYLGRRCDDDDRQISRGLKVFGPTGRWRTQMCNRILVKGTDVDDLSVSPKIRQLMQHWAYKLTDADLEAHATKKRG